MLYLIFFKLRMTAIHKLIPIDISILKELPKIANKYRLPNTKKAIIQLCTSVLPYIALWISMYFMVQEWGW